MPAKRPPGLDRTDIKILAVLQREGRSTIQDLAEKIGLSPRASLERVRRLEASGVIAGYQAQINLAKLSAWVFNNGYDSERAANSELLRAAKGAEIRTALSQINTGPSAIPEMRLAQAMSGADPSIEPKTFVELLRKSNEYNSRALNKYEDDKEYYLGGTRMERQFSIDSPPTAPSKHIARLLENRDDKAVRATFNDLFGEGSAELEIERAKRRERRRQ